MTAQLEVRDLLVRFKGNRGLAFSTPTEVRAVDGVSFAISRGRTLGLIGESGSGKSTTALAVMRLIEPSSGSILLDGLDLTSLSGRELRRSRANYQIIFQDPYSALDPRRTMAELVGAPLDRLERGTRAERVTVVDEMIAAVGLRGDQKQLYPHQFSGGQRQRINIARALVTAPRLVVCDEPTSALDVAVQAQVLNLLRRLQAERHLTYLFISHDMAVVDYMCDDVVVLYAGRVVEEASGENFFERPLHPYSQALIASVPRLGAAPTRRAALTGELPDPAHPLVGCRFAPRCPHAVDRCRSEIPALLPVAGGGRRVACHLAMDAS